MPSEQHLDRPKVDRINATYLAFILAGRRDLATIYIIMASMYELSPEMIRCIVSCKWSK